MPDFICALPSELVRTFACVISGSSIAVSTGSCGGTILVMLVVPKTIQIHVAVGAVSLEVLILAPQVVLLVSMFAGGGLVKHALEVYTTTPGIVVNVCCDEVYVCWSLSHVILLLLVRRIRPM